MHINNAMDLLKQKGSLTMGNKYHHPSQNELDAYNSILLSKDPDVIDNYYIHEPTKNLILMPLLNMIATLRLPDDTYPYTIINANSCKTVTIQELEYYQLENPTQYLYRIKPNGKILTIRLNKKGHWAYKTNTFTISGNKST